VNRSVALVVICSFVAGCGTGTRLGADSTAIKVASTLPPPDSRVVVPDITPYHVLPGDELTVSIFGASDLDRTGVVDAAGDFSMPLAGTLHVAGKTPDEIIADVQDRLRGGYLKNPQVAVNVKQASAQQVVTIDGEVQQPGIYPVAAHMTLQQAVATAKGASDTANIRDVIIFRTSENQKMAAMFNLKAIRSGQQPDPEIYGNDIIIVGESAIQKALRNAAYLAPFLGRFVPVL
jgi:polysaccharide export outer membrane protein